MIRPCHLRYIYTYANLGEHCMEPSINPQRCFTTALFSDMHESLNVLMETYSFLAIPHCELKQYVKKRRKSWVTNGQRLHIKRKSTVKLKPAVCHSIKRFKLLSSSRSSRRSGSSRHILRETKENGFTRSFSGRKRVCFKYRSSCIEISPAALVPATRTFHAAG